MRKFFSFINTFIPALIVMLGLIVLQLILHTVFAFIFPVDDNGTFAPVPSAILNIAYGVIASAVMLVVYKGIDRYESKDTIKIGLKGVVLVVLIGICTQILLEALLQFVYLLAPDFILFGQYNDFMQDIDGSKTVLIYIYTLLFAPITEELVFRGIILGRFRNTFGDVTSNIFQAVLFAVFHFQLVQSSYAFIAGLILGYVMCERNNIVEVIMIHIVINLTGVLIMPYLTDALYALPVKPVWFFILLAASCAGMVMLLKAVKNSKQH